MNSKKCNKCKENRSYGEFYKNKSKKDGRGVTCKKCINESIKKDECSVCNNLRAVRKKLSNGGSLCFVCYANQNKKVCFDCDKLKAVRSYVGDNPICGNCYLKRNKKVCSGCGKLKVVHSSTPNVICSSCYCWINSNALYKKYKHGAEIRGLQFNLTLEEFDIIISDNCKYCRSNHHIGVDRTDSDLGYIVSNCVSCCSFCNMMKKAMHANKFTTHILKIADYVKRKS